QPIIESASDLMGLLERLILIARASAAPVAPAPVDMGQVAWSARERLASAIASSGAEISEPDQWPTVLGVGEWLERIWQNLLANALRFGGPKPRIEIGWEQNGKGPRFFVRDYGSGVPGEIAPMLFRPFHQ